MNNDSGLLGLWREAAIRMLPSRLLRSMGKSGDRSADPVAAYLDRAKRGMSDQEIRWIVDDFRGAGLDQPPAVLTAESIETFRKKQIQWYLQTLQEGLRLTSSQQEMARATAADLPFTPGGIGFLPLDVSAWLPLNDYAPWNLCSLTPEQESLTLKAWVTTEPGSTIGWTSEGEFTIQDPLTGNLTEWSETQEGMRERMAEYLRMGNVFPLTPDQPLLQHPTQWLAQARLCHPAQLRMALLREPATASTLQRLLDQAAEQQSIPSSP